MQNPSAGDRSGPLPTRVQRACRRCRRNKSRVCKRDPSGSNITCANIKPSVTILDRVRYVSVPMQNVRTTALFRRGRIRAMESQTIFLHDRNTKQDRLDRCTNENGSIRYRPREVSQQSRRILPRRIDAAAVLPQAVLLTHFITTKADQLLR